jgi:DNA segregation ATPase FtsK/SpoIIIE, S-DNA-T family
MTRMEQRLQVIRGCAILLAVIVCAFLWLSILSFDPLDWPSPHAWPHPEPSNNNGGRAGAWIAFHLFLYFGKGVYAAVGGLSMALVVLMRQGRLPSLWQRVLGIGLLVMVLSASAHLLTASHTNYWPELRGGVLGYAIAGWLHQSVKWMTYPILAYCAVVGMLFTAEGAMLRIPRALRKHSDQLREMTGGFGPITQRLSDLTEPIRRAVSELSNRTTPALAASGAGGEKAGKADKEPKISAGRKALDIAARVSSPGSKAALAEADEDGDETAPTAKDRKRSQSAAELDPPGDEGTDEAGKAVEQAIAERKKPAKFDIEPADDDDADQVVDGDDDDIITPAPAPEPRPVVVNFPAPPKGPPTVVPITPAKPYPAELPTWEFPPLTLLGDPEYNFNSQQEELVREKAKVLERTLQEYRIEASVVEIDTGPVITMFELNVAPGVKVSQIVSLANDIARSLKAPNVRVVAPIPGKNTIGVEVPNLDKEKVRLKELMTMMSEKWQKMPLPLFLGKDASGHALVNDLAGMPHLLIAGTTGSGKSVCINSIIMSILMTQRPDMVKLILVDPKMVEMSMYREVPHLMCPIVTEMERAEKILEWATVKMDERYALLNEAGVRNITAYNRLSAEEKFERFQPSSDDEKAQIPSHLPYIVIIIDELADMMMMSAKEVELHLSRLAQKSRAVGIHIIVATQRPEAKIVTGLIKSNLPCRIAFRVASRMDSRIVLDQNGAEVLMGQGDMLFLPPGSCKLVRAQGTYLDDNELKELIKWLKERAEPEFHPELIQLRNQEASGDGPRDELFDQAVEIILQTKRGSVSLLQRRLTIGYSRASRLIDEMANAGIVGAYKGSQAREVLITADEWQAMREQEAARIRTHALDSPVDDDMFDDDID